MQTIKEEIEKKLAVLEYEKQPLTQQQDWELFGLIHDYSGPNFDEYMDRFLIARYNYKSNNKNFINP